MQGGLRPKGRNQIWPGASRDRRYHSPNDATTPPRRARRRVTTDEAKAMARQLARTEAIFAGPSTGGPALFDRLRVWLARGPVADRVDDLLLPCEEAVMRYRLAGIAPGDAAV